MSKTKSALTVATLSHVHQALVALSSAREHSAYQSFYLFVPDAPANTIKRMKDDFSSFSWVQFFGPDELNSNQKTFKDTFQYYGVFEVANISKYVAIAHALSLPDCGELLVFTDADTYYLQDISPLIYSQTSALTLFPHLLEPNTIDQEHEILVHGWINGGLMIFSRNHPTTSKILEWLIDRISRRAFYAPQLGINGDQLWLTSLPILFHQDVKLSTVKNINVAYWNVLKERPVTLVNQVYHVGDHPLIMFHFSGYHLSKPQALTQHINVPVSAGSPLSLLIDQYRTQFEDIRNRFHLEKDLDWYSYQEVSLRKKIRLSQIVNPNGVYKTMKAPGIFTRMGEFLDHVVRKIFSLISGGAKS